MPLARRVATLAVVGVLTLASCGGDSAESDGDRARAGCSEAVSAASAVKLRFQIADASTSKRPAHEMRSALCARLEARGVRDVQLRTVGDDEIVVRAPHNRAADVRAAATPTRLHFYDWEQNVIGDRGPDRPFAGGRALFDAVTAASRAKPSAEATDVPVGAPPGLSHQEADRRNDTAGDRYYLFDSDRRLLAGPAASRDGLKTPRGTPRPPGSQVLEVPRGILVVEAQRAPGQPDSVKRLFVLEDDAALSSSDIKNPEPSTDQQTQEPIVAMEFTENGRKAFAALTKRIAARGSQTALPPGVARDAALQRFAITLDDEVVSLATIDWRENPEGIDGRTGAQINGTGSVMETRRLARSLKAPLPGELVPVSSR